MEMRPAALAFDAIAPVFDDRFGAWRSVAAQRNAVRRELLSALPAGALVLELGGGTGEDASFLARQGYRLLLTDPSPAMVAIAREKLRPFGSRAEVLAAEDLETLGARNRMAGGPLFDGAFSNYAALNCVADLAPTVRGLAQLVKPRGAVMLVLFGILSPGEIVVECLRGRPRQAFRRFRRDAVAARLAGRHFSVRYHRGRDVVRAMQPWFKLRKRVGIGVFVPPSAAEPWISRHPQLLDALEALDCALSRPLAPFGDHILYHFERTDAP